MADESHLDEFSATQQQRLSQKLVSIFIEGNRDPAVKTADLITRLKDVMEQSLKEPSGAPESSDRP